jgi:copper homeostasis protein
MGGGRPDHVLLEVIATSVEDARAAEAGGADRLEVAQHLERDGLTPGMDLVDRIRESVSIPIHVMIRPRNAFSGYSVKEIDSMHEDLLALEQRGVNGVVVGFLSGEGEIDFGTLGTVVQEARGLSITFHRAFDHVRDQRRALTGLMERTGVHRILTSGGASSAFEGKAVLADLVRHAGRRMTLVAGGGVTAGNLPLLARETGVREFHVCRSVRTPPSYCGIVDRTKVRHLAGVAETIRNGTSTPAGRHL